MICGDLFNFHGPAGLCWQPMRLRPNQNRLSPKYFFRYSHRSVPFVGFVSVCVSWLLWSKNKCKMTPPDSPTLAEGPWNSGKDLNIFTTYLIVSKRMSYQKFKQFKLKVVECWKWNASCWSHLLFTSSSAKHHSVSLSSLFAMIKQRQRNLTVNTKLFCKAVLCRYLFGT